MVDWLLRNFWVGTTRQTAMILVVTFWPSQRAMCLKHRRNTRDVNKPSFNIEVFWLLAAATLALVGRTVANLILPWVADRNPLEPQQGLAADARIRHRTASPLIDVVVERHVG